MKKTLLLCIVTSLVLLFTITGCKKEDKSRNLQEIANHDIAVEKTVTNGQGAIYDQTFTISPYGFLVFDSAKSVDTYIAFLLSSTHSEIQSYLGSLNFTSLGSTLYGTGYSHSLITTDQVWDYLIDAHSIVQIQGLVFRPVNANSCTALKWEYVLVMLPQNLSSRAYQNLANGVYDESVMNKIAVKSTNITELRSFTSSRPWGYEERTISGCPTSNEQGKFWGWGSESCVEDGQVFNAGTENYDTAYKGCKKHYIFWIVDQTDCYIGSGCR